MNPRITILTFGFALLTTACPGEKSLDREALLDPQNCQDCHPKHFEEWSGSMHAYAADDPVFLAMNARGQRETDGALGDFCVQCHAPMALREGVTTDGLNLDEVPQHLKGVTCVFCHTADAVTDDHNNPVELADDMVLRGGLPNPFDNDAHESKYSTLHDRIELESSDLCGSCHDIVTPRGVELERTFSEWKGSLYSHQTVEEQQTCGFCHMQGSDGVAADVPGVPLRRIHAHGMVGVDVALTDWPQKEAQRARIQRELDTTVVLQLCVERQMNGVKITVDLENLAAGHAFPSGAAHDRRAWVEVNAYLANNLVFSTGAISSTVAVAKVDDPNLWILRDNAFDENGEEAHMFWDIASVESSLLMPPTALPGQPGFTDTHVARSFDVPIVVDRVEARVHIRPLGLDVIDDLIDSGDLDPVIRERIPTFTLRATDVVWTPDPLRTCVPEL